MCRAGRHAPCHVTGAQEDPHKNKFRRQTTETTGSESLPLTDFVISRVEPSLSTSERFLISY
jgi:hypothetical protein